MRAALVLALGMTALLAAAPAAAQVAVVRGGQLVRDRGATAAEVDAYVQRADRLLQRVGIATGRLDDTTLSDETLAPYHLVVLPRNRLDAPSASVLERFAARGGRWIAFRTDGAPQVDRLMGVTPRNVAPAGSASAIELEGGGQPGRPARIAIGTFVARWVDPVAGAQVVGHWTMEGKRIPAVSRGAGGTYVAALLTSGDEEAKSWFLISELAHHQPSLLAEAHRNLRTRVAETLARVAERWSRARLRPGWSAEERAFRERRLAILRGRLPAANPPSATEALFPAIAVARDVLQDVRMLGHSMTPPRDGELRGVWLHFYTVQDWDTIMRNLRDHGFNAIFARMGRGGNVTYPSDYLPRDTWAEAANTDEMGRGIEAAHRYGIQFHAWRVNFHMGSAPRAWYDRMAAEDRLVRDPQGTQSFWTNPGDPRNTELEFNAMLEMVRRYDVDGIHFDYIRYPDDPHYDFDYGPVSRREFEKSLGRSVASWPDDVISGSLKTAYEDWERDNINRLVERVYRETKRLKPWVQVSAAVWRNHRRYRAVIKQDWPLWIEQGWLDFAVPMDYTPEHDTLAATVEAQVALTRGRVPLVAGIGTWLQPGVEEVVRQVEIAREQGAAGFVLFAYNDERIDEILAALHAGATSRPTAPAILGPKAAWRLNGARELNDTPLQAQVGQPLTVRLRLRSDSDRPERVRQISGELTLEDPEGRFLAHLGDVSHGSEATVRLVAPAGRFRPVLRGTATYADGKQSALILAGPLVEGVGQAEWQALLAQDEPPRPEGPGRRVGVYGGGLGSPTLLQTLNAEPGISAFSLHHLQADHLRAAEVLVLPQLWDVADLTPDAISALRRFVQNGGTLILTHDAVGARWHPRLFPEIGVGAALRTGRRLTVDQPLGTLAAGAQFEYAYVDHIAIRPATGVEVLAREDREGGEPVVVRGRLGRGWVVLNGTIPGYGSAPMTEGERALLVALVTGG